MADLSCVASTLATRTSESPCPSTCMASPLIAGPPFRVILESAFRASSLSRDNLAMTLTAASCWYSAVLNSCRVCANCCLSVYVSRARASHSFWNTERRDGIEVRVGGRGRTTRADLTSTKSSTVSSSFVTGSVPFSVM